MANKQGNSRKVGRTKSGPGAAKRSRHFANAFQKKKRRVAKSLGLSGPAQGAIQKGRETRRALATFASDPRPLPSHEQGGAKKQTYLKNWENERLGVR